LRADSRDAVRVKYLLSGTRMKACRVLNGDYLLRFLSRCVFECVNMLPHLIKRDLSFDGVVLIGSSLEETLERNKKDPRWGNTPELQELEANTFFNIERPHYKEEALEYGYPIFERADDAVEYCLKILF